MQPGLKHKENDSQVVRKYRQGREHHMWDMSAVIIYIETSHVLLNPKSTYIMEK